MSKRVSYKLRGEEASAALDFANAVGQPLDTIARMALIKYINDILAQAEAMHQKLSAQSPATIEAEQPVP